MGMKITRQKKFLLGLFMASGIIAGILIFFWLGVTGFYEEGTRYTVYFDESVQGLVVDSPVKFRGVTIGQVTQINVAPDARHVEVVLLIKKGAKITPQMYAQLKVVGITGVMFVEINIAPEKERPKPPTLSFTPPYPVIPSRPSEISQIFNSIDKVLSQLNKLDLAALGGQFQETLQNFDRTATTVRTAVDHLQIKKGVASFQATMDQLQEDLLHAGRLLTKVNALVERQQPQVQEALAEFKDAMTHLNQFTQETSNIAANTGQSLVQLNRQLRKIGRNLEQATGNLNRAVEEFANQPSQLLFRGAPPPRKLPQ
jgi:phospholipid/cholesterol/gamma-HCH transport system substrate-binding protein